jgi:hypothetical protein
LTLKRHGWAEDPSEIFSQGPPAGVVSSILANADCGYIETKQTGLFNMKVLPRNHASHPLRPPNQRYESAQGKSIIREKGMME